MLCDLLMSLTTHFTQDLHQPRHGSEDLSLGLKVRAYHLILASINQSPACNPHAEVEENMISFL